MTTMMKRERCARNNYAGMGLCRSSLHSPFRIWFLSSPLCYTILQMNNKDMLQLYELAVAFFINLAAGFFLAIYATPQPLEKFNAFLTCIACFYMAYAIHKRQKE
jgi:uncharacterized membrane protein YfcA